MLVTRNGKRRRPGECVVSARYDFFFLPPAFWVEGGGRGCKGVSYQKWQRLPKGGKAVCSVMDGLLRRREARRSSRSWQKSEKGTRMSPFPLALSCSLRRSLGRTARRAATPALPPRSSAMLRVLTFYSPAPPLACHLCLRRKAKEGGTSKIFRDHRAARASSTGQWYARRLPRAPPLASTSPSPAPRKGVRTDRTVLPPLPVACWTHCRILGYTHTHRHTDTVARGDRCPKRSRRCFSCRSVMMGRLLSPRGAVVRGSCTACAGAGRSRRLLGQRQTRRRASTCCDVERRSAGCMGEAETSEREGGGKERAGSREGEGGLCVDARMCARANWDRPCVLAAALCVCACVTGGRSEAARGSSCSLLVQRTGIGSASGAAALTGSGGGSTRGLPRGERRCVG